MSVAPLGGPGSPRCRSTCARRFASPPGGCCPTPRLEDLRDDQLTKLWDTLASDPQLTDLHLTWIAKQQLRDLLALRVTRAHSSPAPSVVRQRWTTLR